MRLTWVLLVAALLAVDVDARKKSGGGHRKEEPVKEVDEPVAEKKIVRQKHAKIVEIVDEEHTIEVSEYIFIPTSSVGIKYSSPAPFPQVGIKRAYVPAASSTHLAYKDVDEDKIDEILRESRTNLVIFFYDGRAACPSCGEALAEIEEIDDDIEATGYVNNGLVTVPSDKLVTVDKEIDDDIEAGYVNDTNVILTTVLDMFDDDVVVKTDDRSVAKELGVTTFPSLVYYRRKNPILYDGEFGDSEVVLRWLRSHEEVATWDLTDDNFEKLTDSHSPDEGTLDWFVMFYNAENSACHSYVALWETVAHKLRGLVNVGKVEMGVNDDVSERFHVEKGDCPTFLLLHRGKMYRYKDTARDVRSLFNFAMFKFKELRGHRVPDPPSAVERVYELCKEKIIDALRVYELYKEKIALDDSQTLSVLGVGGLLVMVAATLIIKAYRIKAAEREKTA
ncbi:hypothetical protein PRIPAC_85603 [Pristionchus pacificus]|nr:hypothetical protein PRIPAC_85603 [Pristionchus pacificus]|eukprot:PDM67462.1 Thioredoxin [Pristionchus pacificus]